VALDSFRAYPSGPIGRIIGERLTIFNEAGPAPLAGAFHQRLVSVNDVPQVGVVYLHAGCGDAPLRLWRGTQCPGLVIAAFGAGTMPAPMAAAAREMAAEGCVIVVSSRVGEVAVQLDTMTVHEGGGLLASGVLNPPKSAILLSLALADGLAAPKIKQLLDRIAGSASGSD
jgi:L-asparaginase